MSFPLRRTATSCAIALGVGLVAGTTVSSAPSSAFLTGPSQPTARMRLVPAAVPYVAPGYAFAVQVWIDDPVEMAGFQFTLRYDPEIVAYESVELGPLLGSTGRDVIELPVDLHDGFFSYGAVTNQGAPGPSVSGLLAVVHLFALAEGESTLDLDDVKVTDTMNEPQDTVAEDGRVVVRSDIFLPAAHRP